MAAEEDYNYYGKQKTTSLQTAVILSLKQNWYEIASGQRLHDSKSMYKVDLQNYMHDVSGHLKTF